MIGLYRPFVKRHLYFSPELNEMQYRQPEIFAGENRVICFTDPGSQKPFMTLVSSNVRIYVWSARPAAPNASPSTVTLRPATASTTSPTGRWRSSGRGTRIKRHDHEARHLPLRLRRAAPPRVPGEIRAQPQARTPAHPVLRRLLAMGRLGRAVDGAAPGLRAGRAVSAGARRRDLTGPAKTAGLAPKPRLIARKEAGVIEVDTATTLRGVPPEAVGLPAGHLLGAGMGAGAS